MKPVIYSTNKKLLLSLAVVAGAVFLVMIGVWINNKILNGAEQKARLYQTAIQTHSDREFNYSIDTKQGRLLAQVTIKQVDTVKFPEMNKEFPAVDKTEETYTQHEREDCYTDDDGDEHCHTEYYYEWDKTNSWSVEAKEVLMADRKYPMSMFALGNSNIDAKDIINGQTEKYTYIRVDGGIFGRSWLDNDTEGDKRYSYAVLELPTSGTVFLNVSEGVSDVFGGKIGLSSASPKQLITDAQNASHTQSLIFNIFWTILVLAELLGLGCWVWFYEE